MESLPPNVMQKIAKHLQGRNATAFALSSRVGAAALAPRREARVSLAQALRDRAEKSRAKKTARTLGRYRGRHALRTLPQLGRAAAAQIIGAFHFFLLAMSKQDFRKGTLASGFQRATVYDGVEDFTKDLVIHNYTARLRLRTPAPRTNSYANQFGYVSLRITFLKHLKLPAVRIPRVDGPVRSPPGKEPYIEKAFFIIDATPQPGPARPEAAGSSASLRRVDVLAKYVEEASNDPSARRDIRQIKRGLSDAKFQPF
jgi:hypothetical protein